MHAAVSCDSGVVGPHIGDDIGDLGDALLFDGAVLTLDLFAGDQLLAVAEPAVRGAGRHHIQQAHLIFVQQSFDRAEVHLVAGIFGSLEVERLIRCCLHQLLQGGAVAGELEVVTCHLDGHALFDVACGAADLQQPVEFGPAVEVAHVLGGGALDERVQAVEDLPVIAWVLDVVENLAFSMCGLIFCDAHGFLRSVDCCRGPISRWVAV